MYLFKKYCLKLDDFLLVYNIKLIITSFSGISFFLVFSVVLPYLTIVDQEPLNRLIISLSKYFNINLTEININLSEVLRIFSQTLVWLFFLTFIVFINKELVKKNKSNKNKFKLWNLTVFNILNVIILVLYILVFSNILIHFVDIELLTSILYIYDLEMLSPLITELENYENLINNLVFGYFFIILLFIFINYYNDL